MDFGDFRCVIWEVENYLGFAESMYLSFSFNSYLFVIIILHLPDIS